MGKIVETNNVKIDDSISSTNKQEDPDERDEGEIIQENEEEENQEEEHKNEEEGSNQQAPQTPLKTPNQRVHKNHPPDQIIGNTSNGVETRRRKQVQTPEQLHLSLLLIIEPKDVEEAKKGQMLDQGNGGRTESDQEE